MQRQTYISKKEKPTLIAAKSLRFKKGLLVFVCAGFFVTILAIIGKTRSSLLLQQISPKEYKDLTYIKPFTSLVSFNGKFCKESKTRNTKKTSVFGFPHFNW